MNIIFSDKFLYFIIDVYMYENFIQTCSFQWLFMPFEKLSLFQLELIFALDAGYF